MFRLPSGSFLLKLLNQEAKCFQYRFEVKYKISREHFWNEGKLVDIEIIQSNEKSFVFISLPRRNFQTEKQKLTALEMFNNNRKNALQQKEKIFSPEIFRARKSLGNFGRLLTWYFATKTKKLFKQMAEIITAPTNKLIDTMLTLWLNIQISQTLPTWKGIERKLKSKEKQIFWILFRNPERVNQLTIHSKVWKTFLSSEKENSFTFKIRKQNLTSKFTLPAECRKKAEFWNIVFF